MKATHGTQPSCGIDAVSVEYIWPPAMKNLPQYHGPNWETNDGRKKRLGQIHYFNPLPGFLKGNISYHAYHMTALGKPIHPAPGVNTIWVRNEAQSHGLFITK
jgi:hypothetical protein